MSGTKRLSSTFVEEHNEVLHRRSRVGGSERRRGGFRDLGIPRRRTGRSDLRRASGGGRRFHHRRPAGRTRSRGRRVRPLFSRERHRRCGQRIADRRSRDHQRVTRGQGLDLQARQHRHDGTRRHDGRRGVPEVPDNTKDFFAEMRNAGLDFCCGSVIKPDKEPRDFSSFARTNAAGYRIERGYLCYFYLFCYLYQIQ